VKQISLRAELFATEDDKGSMRSDLAPADPHSQWKRTVSDGKDGTSSTREDVSRLHVASVKRHRDR